MLFKAIYTWFYWLVLIGLNLFSAAAADTLLLTEHNPAQALGKYLRYLPETAAPLTLADAMQMRFKPSDKPILTFGIGAHPVWLHLTVNNPGQHALQRQLTLENSWLDQIEVYFVVNDHPIDHYRTGDSYPYVQKPIIERYFAFPHSFEPGITDIYLRLNTPDPLVAPLFLASPQHANQRILNQAYSYGFIYGYLLALASFNLLIYFGLKHKSLLWYASFICVFILLNIAYTGHGFAWLWPSYPEIQRWIIPLLMLLYGLTGLGFAMQFLNTTKYFPITQRVLTRLSAGCAGLILLAMLVNQQSLMLKTAFVFITFFSLSMLLLGLRACYAGHPNWRYFLLASISSMIGATVTSLTVWGFIGFSDLKYRAVELGMLADATLLALALVDSIRVLQSKRQEAEQLAARDPLTSLNNRRSFLDKAHTLLSIAQRRHRPISIILLDIDRFKTINDRYGHAAGDEVLLSISHILQASARNGDLIARWGGEEFLVLLPETDLAAAMVMAERLRFFIAETPLFWQGDKISFTASFGVSQYQQQSNLNELISEADHYLYQSKDDGRNTVRSRIAYPD